MEDSHKDFVVRGANEATDFPPEARCEGEAGETVTVYKGIGCFEVDECAVGGFVVLGFVVECRAY